MPIEYEGLSDRRSTSRMGKIRLGKKARSAKGKEYPQKLDYFRIDPDDETLAPILAETLGEKPKRLSVMFVSGDRELIFPQYLKKYGKSGLLCKGLGGVDEEGNPKPVLMRVTSVDDETGEVTIDDEYPCDPANCEDYQNGRCKRLASLSGFILCDFPGIRTWQIDTTSKMSIENLNSRLDELEGLATAIGREKTVAGIPLVLSLNPVQVRARDKEGKPLKKKQTVYIMDVDVDSARLVKGGPTLAFLGKLVPPSEDEAPDGLFSRRDVEDADLVAERIEEAGSADEPPDPILANLPDDIAEGIRNVGLSKRQVRTLVKRFLLEGEETLNLDARARLNRYLSGLVDLKLAQDEASLAAIRADLDNEEGDEIIAIVEATEIEDAEDDDPGPAADGLAV